jgi:leader peptidase (prepilin peptidase)/N-methyltransferase
VAPPDLLLSPWPLAVLGLVIGSFLNVVVHRLPPMLERRWWADVAAQLGDAASYRRIFGTDPPAVLAPAAGALDAALAALAPLSIARPASRCPSCGHRIRWYENVPVVSWLALRGRCSACRRAIGWRYPLVELATAIGFGLAGSRFAGEWTALLWCGFIAAVLALALIDWDTTLLPDALTLPLLWAGIGAAALGWLPGLSVGDSLAGAAAGYLSLAAVYLLFKLATGKEGMGFGDFKLLAALGAWLGWQALLPIVLFASVIGAAVGIAMKVAGALREGRFVPFGPFLAAGGLGVLFVGLPRVLDAMGWA